MGWKELGNHVLSVDLYNGLAKALKFLTCTFDPKRTTGFFLKPVVRHLKFVDHLYRLTACPHSLPMRLQFSSDLPRCCSHIWRAGH